MGHPPRISVSLRWEQSVIYFVTICVKGRKRVLANDESLHEKWLYLQENPDRAGLVKECKEWPYRFESNEE
jgi:hypothetical protein